MLFDEWEPVYEQILKDLDIDRMSDEASARLLKMLTLNSDIIQEEGLFKIIGKDVAVAGGNISEDDIGILKELRSSGRTIISAGSATDVLLTNHLIPDIVVTDLDGDIGMQKKASASGAVTFVHAHGDNAHLITEHMKDMKGRIIITTQSAPDMILCNFGGFTDGDRAVCTARHFGAKNITLVGFDMDNPSDKPGTDPGMKRKKLQWAKKIILDMNPSDVTIISL
ncbi:MAG: DUF115 domain-containing protein [Methanomassiliicoccaceae archaeon]|jgi:uncharacterized Rossmann fold enzyme|nr:DUF115 domain-containing protein [Methanomassiliicoccaceae archaeon]